MGTPTRTARGWGRAGGTSVGSSGLTSTVTHSTRTETRATRWAKACPPPPAMLRFALRPFCPALLTHKHTHTHARPRPASFSGTCRVPDLLGLQHGNLLKRGADGKLVGGRGKPPGGKPRRIQSDEGDCGKAAAAARRRCEGRCPAKLVLPLRSSSLSQCLTLRSSSLSQCLTVAALPLRCYGFSAEELEAMRQGRPRSSPAGGRQSKPYTHRTQLRGNQMVRANTCHQPSRPFLAFSLPLAAFPCVFAGLRCLKRCTVPHQQGWRGGSTARPQSGALTPRRPYSAAGRMYGHGHGRLRPVRPGTGAGGFAESAYER